MKCFRSDDTIIKISNDNIVMKNTRNGETDKILVTKHAFTLIAIHYLTEQGYDIIKYEHPTERRC
jgi:hypothetical protein